MEACSPIIVKKISPKSIFLPCKGIWILESQIQENVEVESGILALQSGIQLKESGIQVPLTKTENQES